VSTEHTSPAEEAGESRLAPLVGIALALFVIDQAFDSTVAALLVAAISTFALVRWHSKMGRARLIVTIGILAITLLDFVDAGLLPVIRIQ
jgi:hypothetical protein